MEEKECILHKIECEESKGGCEGCYYYKDAVKKLR